MKATAAMAVTATTAKAMAQAVPEPDRTGGLLGGTGGCSSGLPMFLLKATFAPSKSNDPSKSTVYECSSARRFEVGSEICGRRQRTQGAPSSFIILSSLLLRHSSLPPTYPGCGAPTGSSLRQSVCHATNAAIKEIPPQITYGSAG